MAEIEELTPYTEQLNRVIEALDGQELEARLHELAQIGGEELIEGRIAVSRLALSETDFQTRDLLASWMETSGMKVERHPLGLIGTYHGIDADLAPIAMMSHFDSVPDGGVYDGTYGVVSSIEIVRLLHQHGIQFPRPIQVIALTGEESSRFNYALFGSRGMFQGLTNEELAASKAGDMTISEALVKAGLESTRVHSPRFESRELHAVLELHVSQSKDLEERGCDVAIIEAIAAPVRYEVIIGEDSIEPDTEEYADTRYLKLTVAGESGHSGATPMGREYRADGLLPVAFVISKAKLMQNRLRREGKKVNITIGNILIQGEALNKIPGRTEMSLRVTGDNADEVEEVLEELERYIAEKNDYFTRVPTQFTEEEPIKLQAFDNPEDTENFYQPDKVLLRHTLAAQTVIAVNSIVNKYREDNIVGTIGTYHLNINGQIVLGMDIRGIDSKSRDEAVNELIGSEGESGVIAKLLGKKERDFQAEVGLNINQLAGSGVPTKMDRNLIDRAKQAATDLGLNCEVTFSPAGHDIQNAARAGHRSLLIFTPSRNGGISHSPDEYSNPKDLENGAKVLAKTVFDLASENNGK